MIMVNYASPLALAISSFDHWNRKFSGASKCRIALRLSSGKHCSVEVRLKSRILLASLLLICFPIGAAAQAAPPKQFSAKPAKVSFSGRIRDDGRAILVADRAWIVSNIEKLREYAGQSVRVRGLLDPVTSEIQVLSMKVTRPPVSTSARLGDSAFRR